VRASLANSENAIIVWVMARPEPTLSASRPLRDHGFHRLHVADVVTETPDTVSLVLDVPAELAATFAYAAGQFCNVRVEIESETHVRCYSMSSAPALGEAMQVTVKRVAGGTVSNWINDHLAAGDTVELSPPTGFFQLTDTDGELVAFAAGSGITPVFSLVKTALATTTRTVRLHYANRDRTSVIFDAELRRLEEGHRERLTVARSYDVDHGLLTEDAVRTVAADAAPMGEFYVCGPAPYMEIVEHGLEGLGVEPSRVHRERFSTAELLVGVQRPPAAPAGGTTVTIELDGRTGSTAHRPGTTILQTARQMAMSPPFSCESGSCATCMARLVEGSVSMFVNNALTPDEVEEGWILTCQSVPTTAAVHVVYGFDEP
jgi:3-ketosteroid 9alpha-monooxygenase subunit B